MVAEAFVWHNDLILEALLHNPKLYVGGDKKDYFEAQAGIPDFRRKWTNIQVKAFGRDAVRFYERVQHELSHSGDCRWTITGRLTGKDGRNEAFVVIKTLERRLVTPRSAALLPEEITGRLEAHETRLSQMASSRRFTKRLKRADKMLVELARWAIDHGGLDKIRSALE